MAELFQYLVDTPARPQVKFYVQGTLTDLDGPAGGTCTVTLTRPDGTAGPAAGTVTHVSTGIYEVTIDGPATPYRYDIEWAGTIATKTVKAHTQLEWVGALLFTTDAMRGLRIGNGLPFAANAVPAYSDQQIMDTRVAILDEMSRILGYSPVPRYAIETHSGGSEVTVHEHHVTSLIGVTVSGTSQLVSGYHLHPAGVLRPVSNYLPSTPITYGLGNVTVEYVHGLPRIPGNGSHVAMLWAAATLNPSGFSSASTVSMPDGSTYTYEPSETGRGGFVRHTGIRDVDRWLNRYAESMAA